MTMNRVPIIFLLQVFRTLFRFPWVLISIHILRRLYQLYHYFCSPHTLKFRNDYFSFRLPVSFPNHLPPHCGISFCH